MRADETRFEMWWRWHLYRRWKNEPGRRSMYAFRAHLENAPRGSLAIDCGANIGDMTAAMLAHGLRVIAFEPDPICLDALHRRFATNPDVTIVAKAVGASARQMPLYRSTTTQGRIRTEASSVLQMTHHDREPAGSVEVIDLLSFIDGLGEPLYLLKLDIEGAEVEVMEALLDRRGAEKIGRIFVETHERLDQDLARRTAAIRQRMQGPDFANIDLDWG